MIHDIQHKTVCRNDSQVASTNLKPLRFLMVFSGFIILFLTSVSSYATIVTTLPPLAGMVRMLDPEADVHCLLPPGADAHDFQLSPRSVQTLKQAPLLIRSSFDDGHWPGLSLPGRSLDLWPETAHAWLSPAHVRQQLPRLAAALEKIAPQRKENIRKALIQALKQCDSVDAELKQALAPFQNSGVIMQHNAWQKVLAAYHVPVWSVLESHHHGDNIRPRKLESALAQLIKHPSAALWGNSRSANRGLKWLAKHRKKYRKAQQKILLLNPLGKCSMTWPQLMKENARIIMHVTTP